MAVPDIALGALLVFIATSGGAMAALFIGCVDRTKYAVLLAFAAGAMAYTTVEMLLESHRMSGDVAAGAGFLAGFAFLMLMEKALPHAHLHITKKEIGRGGKKAALVAGAIAIHNIPEGLAVATAFAAQGPLGWFVASSIALQDFPEGAMVSAPLACYGLKRSRAVLFGILSGLVEGAAAVLGYVFLNSFAWLVAPALAFSGGAMAYVILVEILPDAVEGKRERLAAAAFACGTAAAFAIARILAV